MDEYQEQMIARLVEWIEARGLRAPAILLLETHKPLASIGGQALLLVQPLLGLVGPDLGERAAQWAALLEQPGGVERVMERLEASPETGERAVGRERPEGQAPPRRGSER